MNKATLLRIVAGTIAESHKAQDKTMDLFLTRLASKMTPEDIEEFRSMSFLEVLQTLQVRDAIGMIQFIQENP